jgi:hypothetical protein
MSEGADVFDRSDPEDLDLDPETLDPEMHYRYVHERPNRQASAIKKGYRVVSRSEDKVERLTDGPRDKQGATEDLIRNADTILMCCPKEVYEERRDGYDKLTRARMSVPESSFRKKARRAGLKPGQVITTPEKGD